jgi:hemin uptake protein HemP
MPNMSEKSNSPDPHAFADPPPAESPGERVVDSHDLLGGQSQVLIRHEGRIYRLTRTRLGKLILTA